MDVVRQDEVSQHLVSLIQCGPSRQFFFKLVSRDCQTHSHFSCLSFFLPHSASLFYSIIPLYARAFICCCPLRTSHCCVALLASLPLSPFPSAAFFSFPSPFSPSQPRDVCWFVQVVSLTLSPLLRGSQPKSGDWR